MMKPTNHEDAAIQLVFLVEGVERSIKLHHTTMRLKGLEEDHDIIASAGHYGMVSDLYLYAVQVSRFLGDIVRNQNFPGVYEYEVTEALGFWLAENWTSYTHVHGVNGLMTNFAKQIVIESSAFFRRGQP